jgi:hypothetical protein
LACERARGPSSSRLRATRSRKRSGRCASPNALRDKGQLDQALAAYEQIRDQNPKLTAVNLVVGGVYRKKASLEADPTARRALFDRAIASYTTMLSDEASSARAKVEIESTRTEAATSTR